MCYEPSLLRRDFVKGGVGAAMAVAGFPAFRLPSLSDLRRSSERPYLAAALQAAKWIELSQTTTDHGVTWPADPNDANSVGNTLYTHSPGVVTFLLELFHTTGDAAVLSDAMAGADHLADEVGRERDSSAGLYTGLAGLAFVMEETYRASGRDQYRRHAARCLSLIKRNARAAGAGKAWPVGNGDGASREVNDIISGTAGTGLGLLYADRMMGDPEAVELAELAGQRLVERAIPTGAGLKWDIYPGYAREMPNFSHGTAGICYFLAALYSRTRKSEFLDAALAGAAYLKSIATLKDDPYLIYHNSPLGEDLYYLAWCHGPVGTNRLFHQLAVATGDDEWMRWVHMGARGIMGTGTAEVRTPGFWENVSQCGGSAGIGDYFLTMDRLTKRSEYRAYAGRLTSDLLDRSTKSGDGLKWVQSEHRVQPELLVAQTGYMQGAAGIGKYFLHLDAMQRGEGPKIILPDSPY